MKLIIDIHVLDLARAITFYTQVLGLTLLTTEAEWAGITVGDAHIHLYTQGGTKKHVEFYVDDIDDKVKELSAKGVTFIDGSDKPQAISVDENTITTFPWGRTAFFLDSEGNELAVVNDA